MDMDIDDIDQFDEGDDKEAAYPVEWDVEHPEKNRDRINKPERIKLDRSVARRLVQLGLDPYLDHTVEVTIVENGDRFDLNPHRGHWLFSRTAKPRANDYVKEFTAFLAQANVDNFRAYILRPKLAKGKLGQLKETIDRLSKNYGDMIGKTHQEGIGSPILSCVHIRFDMPRMEWDVHLHCIVDVAPKKTGQFFGRLCTNFSMPKEEKIKSVGAWTNYCANWVVDHRLLKNWPPEALKEFWELGRLQLHRKQGAFAKFGKTLKGKSLKWERGKLIVTDKKRLQRRRKRRRTPLPNGGQTFYRTLVIDGVERLCELTKRKRVKENEQKAFEPKAKKIAPASYQPRARVGLYSTTNTASIPTSLIHRQDFTALLGQLARDPSLRRKIKLWRRWWPYGSFDLDRTSTWHTMPRPLKRMVTRHARRRIEWPSS